jgi:hypothetical protein
MSAVTVELRPHWRVLLDPEVTLEEQERWRRIAKEANSPFTVTLSILDGHGIQEGRYQRADASQPLLGVDSRIPAGKVEKYLAIVRLESGSSPFSLFTPGDPQP